MPVKSKKQGNKKTSTKAEIVLAEELVKSLLKITQDLQSSEKQAVRIDMLNQVAKAIKEVRKIWQQEPLDKNDVVSQLKSIEHLVSDDEVSFLKTIAVQSQAQVDQDIKAGAKTIPESLITLESGIEALRKIWEPAVTAEHEEPNSYDLWSEFFLHTDRSFVAQTANLEKQGDLLFNCSWLPTGNDFQFLTGALSQFIKNAVEHGVEKKDERQVAGKSPFGKVEVSIDFQDSNWVVTIEDDGMGVALLPLLQNAEPLNIKKFNEHAAKLKDDENYNVPISDIVELICYSGLSAKDVMSPTSKRGNGLATIHEEIKAKGGVLELKRTGKDGTVVEVTFPAQSPAQPYPSYEWDELILIVDDDEDIVDYVIDLLDDIGLKAITAAHGLEALDQLNNNQVTLVISDMTMPKMTGFGLIAAMAESYNEIPVMFLTGHEGDTGIRIALDVKAAGYLSKPCTLEELRVNVYRAIRRRRWEFPEIALKIKDQMKKVS